MSYHNHSHQFMIDDYDYDSSSDYNHDSVIFPDDKSMSIGCWDSRTTEKLHSLHSGVYVNCLSCYLIYTFLWLFYLLRQFMLLHLALKAIDLSTTQPLFLRGNGIIGTFNKFIPWLLHNLHSYIFLFICWLFTRKQYSAVESCKGA